MQLISKGRPLSLDRPHVMGILNVTPDSFSDGGRFKQIDLALGHARDMVADGATLIDIGGESTRPGAPDVSEQEELDRAKARFLKEIDDEDPENAECMLEDDCDRLYDWRVDKVSVELPGGRP